MINEALLDNFLKGDHYAFRIVFEAYSPRVYGMCYGYFKSREDSEELVQDIFVKLWKYRANIDVTRGVEAYLFRMTKNEIINKIRKSELQTVGYSNVESQLYQEENPEEITDFKFKSEKVKTLIEELPEKSKAVFIARRMENKSNKEVAEEFGLSIKTVENHMTRALSFLRKRMVEEDIMIWIVIWCCSQDFFKNL
ncbi:RNA polymerase sigma factor [Sediminitomix flava]|uniref:RNA polymerase sigma-70 factor (ECF subfamily) n=1 Tax=Sediminitomix flava TaxID=379075 RepID=A0A315YXV1_SEDFL|nr:RNA polymerase sigma-70 factor [Sediminitomix flava]PWJ34978.1 RNA polymerase sigma-70 factor (ECF subfamily) [Sediminitomix flava]